MGILTKAFEKRSQLTNPEQWLLNTLGYRPSVSGVSVSENRAVNSSVVWRAVTLLGGAIGSLPFPVYERMKPRGKKRDPDHRLYYRLHDRPNPEMSSLSWRTMGIANQLIWGNWYNEIEFDRHGFPVSFWPLPPWSTRPVRTKKSELFYEVNLPDGATKRLHPNQVLHVKNLYIDGDEGMSCLRAGREAVGLGLAAEEFGARFYGEGANVGGIIERPGKVKDVDNFVKNITDSYVGLGKAHRLMVLEEGSKYQRVGIPPNEAQFLETRKFQVAEIGRFFFITQLHKLGDLERATFSNIEEQGIDFVVDTIRPLLVNIEQEFNYKLFYSAGQKENFAEFVVDGLLRGNSQARAEFYNKIFQIGGFSVNDILELENRNPIGEEGDERFVPMNMIPLKRAMEEPEDPPEPQFNSATRRQVEKRSAHTRHRITRSYKRIFEDAGKRIVKRESEAIMSKAKELLGNRSKNSFIEWLEEFYKKHPDYVKRQMLPAVTSLAEAIQAEVAGEINVEAGMTPELEKFTQEYVEGFTARHVSSSQGQLTQVVNEAYDAGEDELEALQGRMDEWNERRPGKIASRETVQVNGAVARFAMAAAGVTTLVVRNMGSKTCEFCEELDGKVVGVEQPIIAANSVLTGKNSGGEEMKVYGPKMHPPFHSHCQCSIESE